MKWGLLGVALVVLLAGCASPVSMPAVPTHTLAPAAATFTPVPVTETPTRTPLPGPADIATFAAGGGPIPPRAQVLVGLVIADLAEAQGVLPELVIVEAVDEVTWLDDTLGCNPTGTGDGDLPGQFFPDVTVDGYRISLLLGEQRFIYHSDDQERFLVCESESPAVGEPVLVDPLVAGLVDQARQNLADRLDLPARRVFLVEITQLVWPDSSWGCHVSDQEYVPVEVPGYRVVLRVGRQNYFYHTNYRQVIFCPEGAERLPELPIVATATPGADQ